MAEVHGKHHRQDLLLAAVDVDIYVNVFSAGAVEAIPALAIGFVGVASFNAFPCWSSVGDVLLYLDSGLLGGGAGSGSGSSVVVLVAGREDTEGNRDAGVKVQIERLVGRSLLETSPKRKGINKELLGSLGIGMKRGGLIIATSLFKWELCAGQ